MYISTMDYANSNILKFIKLGIAAWVYRRLHETVFSLLKMSWPFMVHFLIDLLLSNSSQSVLLPLPLKRIAVYFCHNYWIIRFLILRLMYLTKIKYVVCNGQGFSGPEHLDLQIFDLQSVILLMNCSHLVVWQAVPWFFLIFILSSSCGDGTPWQGNIDE
jgi:hypothetical protein